MQNKTYKVSNMSCTSCKRIIEDTLRNKDGVINADVDFINKELKITYENIKEKDIKNITKSLGYKLSDEEEKDNKLKYITIPSLLVLYLTLTHMIKFIDLPIIDLFSYHKNEFNFTMLQFILTTFIVLICRNIYINGFKNLIKNKSTMESLIALGTSSAYLYSIYMTYLIITKDKMYIDSLYYEATSLILFFVLLGKHLEKRSINKTNDEIKKLMDLNKEVATLKSGEKINSEDLKVDDICIIKPGTKIPSDGIILEGSTYIDESLITGESLPILKKEEDLVIGGTINQNGTVLVKILKTTENNYISNIIKLIKEADKKAPIAKIADEVSKYFVPVILLLAVLSFTIWYIAIKDIEIALTTFISVLIIACPCALGLATPVSIIVGIKSSVKKGLLIKSGEALELLSKSKTIVFDKTGTLTIGKPVVTHFKSYIKDEKKVREYLYNLEKKSEHVISNAITSYFKEEELEVTNFKNNPGYGIEGLINNHKIKIGTEEYLDYKNKTTNENTTFYIKEDDKIIGEVSIDDEIKPSSKSLIKKLLKENYNVYMLTGDKKEVAERIGKHLNIKNVISEVKPEDKYNLIKKLREQDKVIMVGDGINDSVALKNADVGISLESATDIAISSADIIILKQDLNAIYEAINISRKTIKNIKQNLFFAFVYNIIFIPVAFGILYPTLLNPIYAGIAMSLSSISVVLNALRLNNVLK